MRSFYAFAPLTVALRAAAMYDDWYFGNMFTLGPTSDDVYITKATYSLVPPPVPCGSVQDKSEAPWLSIWVGVSESMSSQAEDLFQPLLNWSPDQESQACPATNKEWCVATSTYHLSGQVQQPYVTVPNDSQLDFTITVDNESDKIIQQVSINGKEVSKQSDAKSISPRFIYSSNECYLDACGTVNSYTWSNMTIHLSGADKSFGDSLALDEASSSGLKTTDNGKTWHVDSIKIDKDYFYEDKEKRECSSS
ncbi:hypothetical protein MW887_001152 [Aspergillus wentii]|nr:hypothetical protein MW887_001152 [Aspergillus wentii]